MYFYRLLPLMLLAVPATATILTFDILNANYPFSENFPEGFAVPQDYGDRVDSASRILGDDTFNYSFGAEGFTPNVTVSYGPFSILTGGPSLWRYDYGSLDRVLYQGSTTSTSGGTNYNYLLIELLADPGFEAVLYGFELGAWFQTDRRIDGVAVYDNTFNGFFPTLNRIYFDESPLILGEGPSKSVYEFSSPIRANRINILIDANNLGDTSELIGIDNIRFGQDSAPEPVPEPASLLLTAAGLSLAASRRWVKS